MARPKLSFTTPVSVLDAALAVNVQMTKSASEERRAIAESIWSQPTAPPERFRRPLARTAPGSVGRCNGVVNFSVHNEIHWLRASPPGDCPRRHRRGRSPFHGG